MWNLHFWNNNCYPDAEIIHSTKPNFFFSIYVFVLVLERTIPKLKYRSHLKIKILTFLAKANTSIFYMYMKVWNGMEKTFQNIAKNIERFHYNTIIFNNQKKIWEENLQIFFKYVCIKQCIYRSKEFYKITVNVKYINCVLWFISSWRFTVSIRIVNIFFTILLFKINPFKPN